MATAPPIASESRRNRSPCRLGTSRPLRVCHVSLSLATGGLERLLSGLARHHDRSLCELEFLALESGGRFAEEIRRSGCVAKVLDGTSRMARSRIGRTDQMHRHFAAGAYDIVHTHNTYPHLYATAAARWAGVPLVVNTRHGQRLGHGRKSRWLFRLASRHVDQIVAVSDDAARLCVDADGIPAAKVTRIWNGIDTQAFASSMRNRQPIGMAVARLAAEKDFPTLLTATALACQSVPNLSLRILGDGPERRRLQSLARQLNIHDRVEFLGECSDVAQQLAQSGFFVTSTLSEGISLTMLEAMAVGLPVIATDVGGNPEIVSDESVGRLVPPKNPERMAAAIIATCEDADHWPAMGTAARRRVVEQFDVRRMAADYEQLYLQLCAAQ